AAGIAMSIGTRYPASHRNNLLQLFTPGRCDSDNPHVRQLAHWAAGGRVHAVQLELGIPLRWPGEWRERLVTAIVAALSKPAPGDQKLVSKLGRQQTTDDRQQTPPLLKVESESVVYPSVVCSPPGCEAASSLIPASLQFYD